MVGSSETQHHLERPEHLRLLRALLSLPLLPQSQAGSPHTDRRAHTLPLQTSEGRSPSPRLGTWVPGVSPTHEPRSFPEEPRDPSCAARLDPPPTG